MAMPSTDADELPSSVTSRNLRRGKVPDDFIEPKTLNPLPRSYLREAFRAVAAVQTGLANELSLGVRWG